MSQTAIIVKDVKVFLYLSLRINFPPHLTENIEEAVKSDGVRSQ